MRQVLDARDPELTRKVLAEHRVAMQERLLVTERIVAQLQERDAPMRHTPVHVRDEPAMDTIRIVGDVPTDEFGPWIIGAFEHLFAFAREHDVVRTGRAGALFSPELADDVEHVVGPFDTADPSAFRTEIAWPIVP